MKLYELPRGSYFKVDSGSLLSYPDNPTYRLDHIDGMYSVCYDEQGTILHFAAYTPVTKVEVH